MDNSTACPLCGISFDHPKKSPCRVADRETGPLSLSTVQATAAAGNPVTLFLYIAADAQHLEPYKLTLESELIIAASDEINQLRDKLTNAKQEITQTIRKLEQIYKQIEIKTL
jgi:hypothetical protein